MCPRAEIKTQALKRASDQRVGVQKQKRLIGQGRQTFDLVAMRIGVAETLRVERQEHRSQTFQHVANARIRHPRVARPKWPRLGFRQIQCARKTRIGCPQRRRQQQRLILQPPRLDHRHNVECLIYDRLIGHAGPTGYFFADDFP